MDQKLVCLALLIVLAVAFAGCTQSNPTPPANGTTPNPPSDGSGNPTNPNPGGNEPVIPAPPAVPY